MAVAKQALTTQSDNFTFIITPKKKPDVLRVRTGLPVLLVCLLVGEDRDLLTGPLGV